MPLRPSKGRQDSSREHNRYHREGSAPQPAWQRERRHQMGCYCHLPIRLPGAGTVSAPHGDERGGFHGRRLGGAGFSACSDRFGALRPTRRPRSTCPCGASARLGAPQRPWRKLPQDWAFTQNAGGATSCGDCLFDRVLAALGHLANGLAKPPHKRATRAQPPGTIEKDDGFRAFEPEGKRLVVVAVDDPILASEQRALPFSPLVVRRSHPARLPVVDVQVNHRQTSPCRERTCERALPGPHHPVDENAVADHPRRTVHGAGIPRAWGKRHVPPVFPAKHVD